MPLPRSPAREVSQVPPNSPAIADQTRLALGVWMSLDDLIDEPGLGLANIFDRLARHWVRQKTDEIARMAGLERNADFAVVFHASNTGTVAGARIEDYKRPFVRVDR